MAVVPNNGVKFVCASGGLGGGQLEPDSFKRAMAMKPDFVAADAGTIDVGPSALGSGECAYSRESVRYELDILLSETPRGVPILIGSAGTAGGDPHVDWTLDIVKDILSTKGLKRKVAVIRSEQDKNYLKKMMGEGRIAALDNAPDFDESTIDRSTRIVGMMGVEPLQDALAKGADFILAGRCSDSALYAALPIMRGIPAGLAWHSGKVVECGPMVCEKQGKGSIFGHMLPSGVVITPIGQGLRCTPQSVAAHSLYENGDPFLHVECSGTLDLTNSTFEQADDVSVRIAGADFKVADQYTVKLEGVELVGYQSVVVGGIRDPYMIQQLDSWLDGVRAKIEQRAKAVLGNVLKREDWRLDIHVFGRNAVMGTNEPLKNSMPHEVGLVLCLTAPTQHLASTLAEMSRQPLLHHPIPEWNGCITGFACLFNQAHIDRGPVWQFCVNHVVKPRSPLEMFRSTIMDFN